MKLQYQIILSLCACLAAPFAANSQSLERLTASDASGVIPSESFIWEYNIGEQFVSTRLGEGIIITEGFLQGSAPEVNVAIQDFSESGYELYPNPVDETSIIVIPNNTKGEILTIMDMNGREVSRLIVQPNQGRMSLPVSLLSNGAYLLYVQSKEGNTVYEEKFIKR